MANPEHLAILVQGVEAGTDGEGGRRRITGQTYRALASSATIWHRLTPQHRLRTPLLIARVFIRPICGCGLLECDRL